MFPVHDSPCSPHLFFSHLIFLAQYRSCGTPQFGKGLVVTVLFGAVLLCLMVSKLGFTALTRASSDAMNTDDESLRAKGNMALAMLLMCLIIPHVVGFSYSVWCSCYKSLETDPYPSWSSVAWIFVQSGLEATGTTAFVLIFAPRVHGLVAIGVMNALFVAPAVRTALKKSHDSRSSVYDFEAGSINGPTEKS